MKLLIASSTKYRSKWPDIQKRLSSFGYEVTQPSAADTAGTSNREDIIRNYLALIDQTDALYVYSPDGEVGVSVATEIGYAYCRGIKVYANRVLNDEGLGYYIREVI